MHSFPPAEEAVPASRMERCRAFVWRVLSTDASQTVTLSAFEVRNPVTWTSRTVEFFLLFVICQWQHLPFL